MTGRVLRLELKRADLLAAHPAGGSGHEAQAFGLQASLGMSDGAKCASSERGIA